MSFTLPPVPISLSELTQKALESLSDLQTNLLSSSPSLLVRIAFKFCKPLQEPLSAKEYYQLFLLIFDGLNTLEDFLLTVEISPMLYSEAQYFPEIVPRLYLVTTIGIILYKQTKNHFYINDIIDFIRGVQHPKRGLFLRYYFNKKIKDLLEENNIESIIVLITNLSEMNSLWSRIEDEKERIDLKITVGENIERISVICNDKDLYLNEVFPRCVEIIEKSDPISQEYLLDCIVQAFPDDFQLMTLNQFMKIACEIQSKTDILQMITTSLNRLYLYLKEIQKDIEENCYFYLKLYLTQLTSNSRSKEIKNFKNQIEIHNIILKFSIKSELGLDNLFHCLENCVLLLDNQENKENLSEILSEMLIFSLELSLDKLLMSNFFHTIYFELQDQEKIKVAHKIIEVLHNEKKLCEDVEFWSNIFEYLEILSSNSENLSEKLLIIRILHRINPEISEIMMNAAQRFRKDDTILIPIAFLCLKHSQSCSKMYNVIQSILAKISNVYISIQISLNTLICYNKNNNLSVIPEIIDKTFEFYEKIVDNSLKILILTSIIGSLVCLGTCKTPLDKLLSICYKLPKKIEQCNILLSLAHVYWSEISKDHNKLLEILKRSVKLADLCVNGTKNLHLFVVILNKYLYFFLKQVPSIDLLTINSIIELIVELLSLQIDKDFDYNFAKGYLKNTILSIRIKQDERFREINTDYKF